MKLFRRGKTPYISIIMVDGSFRESFHAVDFFCQQSLPREAYELIWVEYCSQVKSELRDRIAKYSNARVLTLGRRDLYHSSYCFNVGIEASRGEVLFIPDADIVVEKEFLEMAYKDHKSNPQLVMYFYRLEEPQDKHRNEISLDHLKEVCKLNNPRNNGPCLSVRKSWLVEVNGYEQHPILSSGFHANGLELYTRLKNLGLHIKWHPTLKLYHPWHPFSIVSSPLYELQKTLINYKARNLIKTSFIGLDPSRNIEVPSALSDELEKGKKRYNLDELYNSWPDAKSDPGKARDTPFAWQRFAAKKA